MNAGLYVGTYARAGGAGLYRIEGTGAERSVTDVWSGAPDASFGVFSQRFGLHYLVEEADEGAVRSVPDGWRLVARVPTHGAAPCHLAIDPAERRLAVANYGSGSTALFDLDPQTGLPGDAVTVHANRGRGPVADRQDGPHAHCVAFSPDGARLYQTDLGTDEILAFEIGPDGKLAAPEVAFAAPPGSGPRLLLFHPHAPIAYLVSELASTVTVLDITEGGLASRQVLSTLPAPFSDKSLGGHITLNRAADRLYVTNRGHDSIATFALDDPAQPALLSHVPSGGASPRFMLLQEREMLVANEEGGNVTIFAIRPDGKPVKTGEIAVPGPVFLFADASGGSQP